MSLGNNAQIFLLLSLIFPLLLKLCQTITGVFDLIFDLFNMLQVLTTIRYIQMTTKSIHGVFLIPSIVLLLTNVIEQIVYFKPLQHPLIKD